MLTIKEGDYLKYIGNPNVKLKLQMKMTLIIGLLIISMFAIMGLFLHAFFSDTLKHEVGERALAVAESVARIPELRQAYELDDPAAVIHPLVEPIRAATGAQFIVVGNREEIRYAHPQPERLGEQMVGGDNERALLLGESYVSEAIGSLGRSIRGKVPVRDTDGGVIGVVSVGFLTQDVQTIVMNYHRKLWYVLVALVSVGIVGAVLIARYIKRLLFGLEPEEISHLFLQKETILQSTHEAIIAVNRYGLITLMNTAAQRLLGAKAQEPNPFIGKPILDVLPNSRLHEVLQTGESQYDKEMLVGKHIVLVNRLPIYYQQNLIGAVSTFRNKTELEQLSQELTRVKQYAEALRAQTHEFSNKMFTILGLIQLDKQQEAVDFIRRESTLQQNWIHFLMKKVPDPMISGILLGKLNQALEQRVTLTIDPDSQLQHPFSDRQRDALVTVLGNLIGNAIEAVKDKTAQREVALSFTDIGDVVVFEVDDAGPGIAEEEIEKVFQQGYTTKAGADRGIGLALTRRLLEDIDGELTLEESELGGACFVVTLAKERDGGKMDD
ncbi:sensor histidine kinase [Halalkalibacter oceani]|uniref:sensor histidine kinase n=1 Tax=Halalkalibacter oceani TaxID=1653776 RepID=UPI003391AE9B